MLETELGGVQRLPMKIEAFQYLAMRGAGVMVCREADGVRLHAVARDGRFFREQAFDWPPEAARGPLRGPDGRTALVPFLTAGYPVRERFLADLGALATVVVRDQISRHQRNLFSSQALKRFAALGYLTGSPASIELVQMLRDFCAWEPNGILRRRASQILTRMERQLQTQASAASTGMPAGIAG